MNYFIYKTTNLINNKIYIGKHSTNDIDDDYLGSSLELKSDIIKYGRSSFTREILYECDTLEELNTKERELVTKEFCSREDTYNKNIGGFGGFEKINSVKGLNNKDHHNSGWKVLKERYKTDEDYRRKWKEASFSEKTIKLRTETRRLNGNDKPFLGKKHSEDTKN